METVWNVIRIVGLGLGLIYMLVASVIVLVLLYTAWKRRGTVLTTVQECPYCDGKGVVNTEDGPDTCPLCDGESAIIVRLPAQADG